MRLVVRQMLQRHICALIPLFAILVMQHGVAVGKRAATGILARNTHRIAFGQERGISQMFGHAPIHRQIAAHHFAPVIDNLFHGRAQLEAFWHRSELVSKPDQISLRHGGIGRMTPVRTHKTRKIIGIHAPVIGQRGLLDMLATIQRGAVSINHHVRFRLADHAFFNQLFGITRPHARMIGNFLVHHRLGQERIVRLVMTVTTETDDIDHHIFAMRHAVFERALQGKTDRFRIVAIHMDDRRFNHLGDVSAVGGRTRIAQVGRGKADLVVDHQMHRAAGAVTARLREVERALIGAQADKSRVTMHQHRHHFIAIAIAAPLLARAH